jgi:hypothetical protein
VPAIFRPRKDVVDVFMMHRHRKKLAVLLGCVFLLLLAVLCVSMLGSDSSIMGAVVKGPGVSVPVLIAQFLPAILFIMFLIIGLVRLGYE